MQCIIASSGMAAVQPAFCFISHGR